jgi:hypothetical protein
VRRGRRRCCWSVAAEFTDVAAEFAACARRLTCVGVIHLN